MASQLSWSGRHGSGAQQNLPQLYKNGQPDKLQIAYFVGCNTGAKTGSLRGAAMSRRVDSLPWVIQKKAEAVAEICELVAQGFNGDAKKTMAWFTRKSPWFGNTRPVDMILFDRCEKLKQFVLNARDGHLP